jgi:hypothetical protein
MPFGQRLFRLSAYAFAIGFSFVAGIYTAFRLIVWLAFGDAGSTGAD